MSDAPTFSAPAGPTLGLQGYNLSRKVRNLDPATSTLSRKRQRAAALLRLMRRSRNLHKDEAMTDTIKRMVETLAKSVADIVEAGGDQQTTLLAKSFEEFGDHLGAALIEHTDGAVAEAMTKITPARDPLFKNLGTVGEVANLVNDLTEQVAALQSNEEAPISEDVADLLNHSLATAELALREAVNEQVMLPDEDGSYGDDGDGDGVHVVVLKSADGQSEIEGRTKLPEDLAKFATHPDLLAAAEIELACDVLTKNGVDEGALSKVFDGGDSLTKLANMDGTQADAGQDSGDDGSEGDAGDPLQQLIMLGRLLAASMIQLNGIVRQIEGDDGSMVDPDNDGDDDSSPETDTDQDAGSGEPDATRQPTDGSQDDQKKKPPFAKSAPDGVTVAVDGATVARGVVSAAVADLRKEMGGQIADISDMLKKVLAMPQSPIAIVGPSGSLTKAQDSAPAGSSQAISSERVSAILAKMSDDDAAAARYQISSLGRPAEQVLAKHL